MTVGRESRRDGFRVSARTILQLGGELISSDGIAFYELIKNAVDAGSSEVVVDVTSRLPNDAIEQARQALSPVRGKKVTAHTILEVLNTLSEQLIRGAPGAKELAEELKLARTPEEAMALLDEANFIEFRDAGHGMTIDQLREVYLTIGTPFRLKERRADPSRVVLGEKGIGRLSTMRLGSKLVVRTSRSGEKRWNVLRVDWRDFDRDPDQLLEDVPVAPELGEKKDDSRASGTLIHISALEAEWAESKLRELASHDLSRAMDPFASEPAVPIILRFNGATVPIERLNELLFERAHAVVTAEMCIAPTRSAILTGEIDYRHHRRTQPIRLKKHDLLEAAGGVKPYVLERLGPFSVKLYWYNRQLLDPIEGIGTVKQVRQLIAQWSGGLMVYRDRFRVPPYGGPEDDWLDLDRTALSYKSHKVNRAQLIGKVDISSRDNPHLIDQTNREGLADCPEKAALIAILQNLLARQFRSFLDKVDEEVSLQSAPSVEDLEQRFETQEKELRANIASLRKFVANNPETGLEPLVGRFTRQAAQMRELIQQARSAQETIDRKGDRLMNLAGLGLMVEILAHELNRAVVHSLSGLESAIVVAGDGRLTSLLRTAEVQLKSLQKRISVLDRLSISGRQRLETFDPAEVVREVFAGRAEQFERDGISAKIEVVPGRGLLKIRMVKGMFYQILENLVENSVYWLKSERSLDPGFKPVITVKLDKVSQAIFFSDNGPGIDPVNAERVFDAFFSLKRKERGKGLGLYISREYAKDQQLELKLTSESNRTDGRLNTFVLNLARAVKG